MTVSKGEAKLGGMGLGSGSGSGRGGVEGVNEGIFV